MNGPVLLCHACYVGGAAPSRPDRGPCHMFGVIYFVAPYANGSRHPSSTLPSIYCALRSRRPWSAPWLSPCTGLPYIFSRIVLVSTRVFIRPLPQPQAMPGLSCLPLSCQLPIMSSNILPRLLLHLDCAAYVGPAALSARLPMNPGCRPPPVCPTAHPTCSLRPIMVAYQLTCHSQTWPSAGRLAAEGAQQS